MDSCATSSVTRIRPLVRWRGLNGQLERVERVARVAARDVHEVRDRVVIEHDVAVAVAAFLVRQRAIGGVPHAVIGEGPELEDAAATTSAPMTSK